MRISKLKAWDFNTFDEEILQNALMAASTLLAETKLNAPARWLTLTGRSGVGKSHLTKQIAKFWHSRFHDAKPFDYKSRSHIKLMIVKRFRWSDFCSLSFDDSKYWLKNADYLVLDDIGSRGGTGNMAEVEMSRLLEVCQLRENRWTVFDTNLDLEQFAKIDGRIADRMIRDGSQVFEVNCQSYTERF